MSGPYEVPGPEEFGEADALSESIAASIDLSQRLLMTRVGEEKMLAYADETNAEQSHKQILDDLEPDDEVFDGLVDQLRGQEIHRRTLGIIEAQYGDSLDVTSEQYQNAEARAQSEQAASDAQAGPRTSYLVRSVDAAREYIARESKQVFDQARPEGALVLGYIDISPVDGVRLMMETESRHYTELNMFPGRAHEPVVTVYAENDEGQIVPVSRNLRELVGDEATNTTIADVRTRLSVVERDLWRRLAAAEISPDS